LALTTQQRARPTIDDIFEATAQLLDTEGAGKLNTNRIAVRAGFSIGALYSYFPNKASLLRAMALREVGRHEARFSEQIEAARGKEAAVVVRLIVRQALSPFGGRQNVRRHLIWLVGQDPEVQTAMHRAIDRITDRFLDGIGIDPNTVSRARRFLLLRSVLGPIRAAVTQEPQQLTADFEDELVHLTLTLAAQASATLPSPTNELE
jgi:AcrR family transcriptional regulator